MLDQLTWSLGMLVQCTLVVSAAAWLGTRAGGRRSAASSGGIALGARVSRPAAWVPAAWILLVYLVEILMLWLAYGRRDATALDWGVTVILLGTLLAGPVGGLLASLPAAAVRAAVAFPEGADAATLASYPAHGAWWLEPAFWRDEAWIWLDPGVVQLPVAALAAGAAWIAFRPRGHARFPAYPAWIGVPVGVATVGAFTLAASRGWGNASAVRYLEAEAAPATLGLALAALVLVLALRALTAGHERERAQRAELAAARDRLAFLDAQIDPHYFANALNAIAGVSLSSPARSRELLGELGSQFRARCAGPSLVTLDAELELVRGYVSLERARRGDALEFVETIDPGSLTRRLPRLSVQPLVENALRHGLGSGAGGRVEVRASLEGDALIVTVTDDGGGLVGEGPAPGEGVGLASVRDRLASHCGAGASLTLSGRPGAGAAARMVVPPPPAAPASLGPPRPADASPGGRRCAC